jgi:nicotinamide-nucleotide amidase
MKQVENLEVKNLEVKPNGKIIHPGNIFYNLIMVKADLSIKDVSDLTGITRKQISQLANEEIDITQEIAEKIATGLGGSFEEQKMALSPKADYWIGIQKEYDSYLSPAEKIQKILNVKNETISVAESLTSGLIQSKLAEVSGISNCFEGGITSYSLTSKVNHLDVDPTLAAAVNCVSAEVALQMSHGAQKLFNTQLSIATTGYAEPYPAENIEFPIAYIAVHYNDKFTVAKIQLDNPEDYDDLRPYMRNLVADTALQFALNFISKDIKND